MTDTRDTSERLREYAANAPRGWLYADDAAVFTRAADEIERLRAALDTLNASNTAWAERAQAAEAENARLRRIVEPGTIDYPSTCIALEQEKGVLRKALIRCANLANDALVSDDAEGRHDALLEIEKAARNGLSGRLGE